MGEINPTESGNPKQSLEYYLQIALNGLSDCAHSEHWENLETITHNLGLHGIVRLGLRATERMLRQSDTEEFTIYGLKEYLSEESVLNLINKYYIQQGYILNTDEETFGPNENIFQRISDGEKVSVLVTTSQGTNGVIVIVTSFIF